MQCLWTNLAVLIELLKLQPAVGGLVCAPAAAAAMPTTKPKGEVIEALKARLVLCLNLDARSLIYIYIIIYIYALIAAGFLQQKDVQQ